MQNNQINQGNQLYQQLSNQTSNPDNQIQSNEQMNSPQEYPKPSDFPSNSFQNLNCPPNYLNQQPSNNYVLSPLNQSEKDKLIIPFINGKYIYNEFCVC